MVPEILRLLSGHPSQHGYLFSHISKQASLDESSYIATSTSSTDARCISAFISRCYKAYCKGFNYIQQPKRKTKQTLLPPAPISPALDPRHRVEKGRATAVAGVVRGHALDVRVSFAKERHQPSLCRLGLVQQRLRPNLDLAVDGRRERRTRTSGEGAQRKVPPVRNRGNEWSGRGACGARGDSLMTGRLSRPAKWTRLFWLRSFRCQWLLDTGFGRNADVSIPYVVTVVTVATHGDQIRSRQNSLFCPHFAYMYSTNSHYCSRTSSLPILAGSMPYFSSSPCMAVISTELMSSLSGVRSTGTAQFRTCHRHVTSPTAADCNHMAFERI